MCVLLERKLVGSNDEKLNHTTDFSICRIKGDVVEINSITNKGIIIQCGELNTEGNYGAKKRSK